MRAWELGDSTGASDTGNRQEQEGEVVVQMSGGHGSLATIHARVEARKNGTRGHGSLAVA